MTPTPVQALMMIVGLTVAPLVHASNDPFYITHGSKNPGMAGVQAINPVRFSAVRMRSGGGVDLFVSDQTSGTGVAAVQVPEYSPGLSALSATAFGDKIITDFEVFASGDTNSRYNAPAYTGFTDTCCPLIRRAGLIPGSVSSAPGSGDKVGAGSKKLVQMNPVAAQIPPALSLVTNPSRALMLPAIAYNFSENHSIGFSPSIALEIFRAYGFDSFAGLPGRGNDNPRGAETFSGSGYSGEDRMNLHAVEISYGWLF